MTTLEEKFAAMRKAMEEVAASGAKVKLEPNGLRLHVTAPAAKPITVPKSAAKYCMHRGSACKLCAVHDCNLRTADYE